MPVEQGFFCTYCGQRHDGLPFAYSAPAPGPWHDGLHGSPGTVLGDEQCVINAESFFVRARLVLPVVDDEREFEWGVWISLSKHNFARMAELWTEPRRLAEPPYFGWLATDLPIYEPDTLNLKTNVHTGPVGTRPTVELEPTDHPLAMEQRTGISRGRVQDIAERLLHQLS